MKFPVFNFVKCLFPVLNVTVKALSVKKRQTRCLLFCISYCTFLYRLHNKYHTCIIVNFSNKSTRQRKSQCLVPSAPRFGSGINFRLIPQDVPQTKYTNNGTRDESEHNASTEKFSSVNVALTNRKSMVNKVDIISSVIFIVHYPGEGFTLMFYFAF